MRHGDAFGPSRLQAATMQASKQAATMQAATMQAATVAGSGQYVEGGRSAITPRVGSYWPGRRGSDCCPRAGPTGAVSGRPDTLRLSSHKRDYVPYTGGVRQFGSPLREGKTWKIQGHTPRRRIPRRSRVRARRSTPATLTVRSRSRVRARRSTPATLTVRSPVHKGRDRVAPIDPVPSHEATGAAVVGIVR